SARSRARDLRRDAEVPQPRARLWHSTSVTEHLIVLPDRGLAERIAAELRAAGFTEVRVERGELVGEDDAEPAEGDVHVRRDNVLDDPGNATESGLRERFEALAAEHDGWYDKPL